MAFVLTKAIVVYKELSMRPFVQTQKYQTWLTLKKEREREKNSLLKLTVCGSLCHTEGLLRRWLYGVHNRRRTESALCIHQSVHQTYH